jgi:hypothetical protein
MSIQSGYPFIYLENELGAVRLRAEDVISWFPHNHPGHDKVRTIILLREQREIRVFNEPDVVEKKMLEFYTERRVAGPIKYDPNWTDRQMSNALHGRDPDDNGEFSASAMGAYHDDLRSVLDKYVQLAMEERRYLEWNDRVPGARFPQHDVLRQLRKILDERLS